MAQICANCGASLTDGETFCPCCGAAQPQPAESERPEEPRPEAACADAPVSFEEPIADEAPLPEEQPEAETPPEQPPAYAPVEQPPVYAPAERPPVYAPASAHQLPAYAPSGRGSSPARVMAVLAAALTAVYLLMMIILPVMRLDPDTTDYTDLKCSDGYFYGDAGRSYAKYIMSGVSALHEEKNSATDQEERELKSNQIKLAAACCGILTIGLAAIAMCGATCTARKRVIPGIIAAVLVLGGCGAAYWLLTFLNQYHAEATGVENFLQVSVWGCIAAGFAAVAAVLSILAALVKDPE